MSSEERKERKAVRYAEDNLGVHSLYQEIEDHLTDLNDALISYNEATQQVRLLAEKMEDREIELIGEYRAGDPKIAVAAIERRIKEDRANDDELAALRAEHRKAQDDQTLAESQVTILKYRLRGKTARLNELGGLLTFYAATK